MTFVALVVEGVLRQERGDGVIPQGNALYQLFKDTGRLALITDEENTAVIDHWLQVNGYVEHVHLISPLVIDRGQPPERTRLRQLRRLQDVASGQLAFYVEPNPVIAAKAMASGITVLQFLHPRYMRPSFRPDYEEEITPWETLAAEVERQKLLRAKDARPDAEVF